MTEDTLIVDEIEVKNPKYLKEVVKSILPDLLEVDLPDLIKRKADEIYIEYGCPNKRKEPRKLMIYAFLYQAYNELEIEFLPNDLAKAVGISLNKISSALKFLDTGNNNIVIKTPLNYVNVISQKVCLPSTHINDFRIFLHNIYAINPEAFDDYLPWMITYVALTIYATYNGLVLDTDILLKTNNITIAKTKEISKLIRTLYNRG